MRKYVHKNLTIFKVTNIEDIKEIDRHNETVVIVIVA